MEGGRGPAGVVREGEWRLGTQSEGKRQAGPSLRFCPPCGTDISAPGSQRSCPTEVTRRRGVSGVQKTDEVPC